MDVISLYYSTRTCESIRINAYLYPFLRARTLPRDSRSGFYVTAGAAACCIRETSRQAKPRHGRSSPAFSGGRRNGRTRRQACETAEPPTPKSSAIGKLLNRPGNRRALRGWRTLCQVL
jgi:hypothetical protein